MGNRIRGLLTAIHPALERVLGPRITHAAVLGILSCCGGPAKSRGADTFLMSRWAKATGSAVPRGRYHVSSSAYGVFASKPSEIHGVRRSCAVLKGLGGHS